MQHRKSYEANTVFRKKSCPILCLDRICLSVPSGSASWDVPLLKTSVASFCGSADPFSLSRLSNMPCARIISSLLFSKKSRHTIWSILLLLDRPLIFRFFSSGSRLAKFTIFMATEEAVRCSSADNRTISGFPRWILPNGVLQYSSKANKVSSYVQFLAFTQNTPHCRSVMHWQKFR